MEDEDPAAVLRQLQEDMRKRTLAEGQKVPPAPPRRSGKPLFFEAASQSKDEKRNSSDGADAGRGGSEKMHGTSSAAQSDRRAPGAKKAGQPLSNPFLHKLTKMEAETQSTAFPTYDAAAEGRRKKIDAKIKEERSKMLVFRDVGMDLDKPILSRDVFLVFKYFRYGMEFAVDNELERMLRYFNEHAMNELKIIQDSKLMRGPPTLSRKRRHVSRQKASSQAHSLPASAAAGQESDNTPTLQHQPQFQISSLFPHVRCAGVRQLCAPSVFGPAATTVLSSLMSATQSASSFTSSLALPTGESKATEKKTYNARDSSLFTTVTPSMFRRPAVVIYSQLGQKFGSQADTEWRRLAYASICPDLLPYVPLAGSASSKASEGATPPQSPYGSAAQTRSAKDGSAPRGVSARAMPIDVISLRSADVYKYTWVQRMYVNRFAKSLSQATAVASAGASSEASVDEVNRALIASTTFVGSQLLEPFYTTLGLRNYLLPYVMLVDHEGVIRWLSGGCPDKSEALVFASLLKQLETEYYKASK